MAKCKVKRELTPVRFYENGEIRCLVSYKKTELWHKVSEQGLQFRCKCPRRTELVTWADVMRAMDILRDHRDEIWNFICDGDALLLTSPTATHKGTHPNTRLVSIIWPSNGILTFIR